MKRNALEILIRRLGGDSQGNRQPTLERVVGLMLAKKEGAKLVVGYELPKPA